MEQGASLGQDWIKQAHLAVDVKRQRPGRGEVRPGRCPDVEEYEQGTGRVFEGPWSRAQASLKIPSSRRQRDREYRSRTQAV